MFSNCNIRYKDFCKVPIIGKKDEIGKWEDFKTCEMPNRILVSFSKFELQFLILF